MQTPVFVFEEVDRHNFEDVRNGVKTIETRAATEKYQAVQVGDEITLQCGADTITKKVTKKFTWPTIEAMFEEVPLKRVMPDLDTIDQVRARYNSYPNYTEKLKQHGIVGFELA